MGSRSRLGVALLIAVGPAAAGGQASMVPAGVTLQIKPHAGDTLRMRLDQESEMTGVRRTDAGESSAMLMTTMQMYSRAIVEGTTNAGTIVLAVTDSVLLSTSDDHARRAAEQMEAALKGRRVRFRVSGDGTVTLLDAAGGAMRDVAQVVSLMPATFPKGPIAVGESWLREMSLPASGQIGAQLSGRLQVTFRLDSLARGGDRAFVSMRGDVHPVTGPGAASGTVLDQGLVSGTMVIDQKRHWLSESWFNVVMNSTVNASAATGGKPMRMQMRITQHMHTFDRR